MKTLIAPSRLLTVLALCISAAASADTVRIAVPLAAPVSSESKTKVDETQSGPGDLRTQALLSLDASSWAPTDVSLASRVSGASALESVGLPGLSLTYSGSPFYQASWGSLNFQGGVGYSLFRRHVTLQALVGIAPETSIQDVSWINLRAGVEFKPRALSTRFLATSFGIAVIPAVVAAPQSVFDDGFSLIALPLELSLGVQASGGWIDPSLQRVSIYGGGLLTDGAIPVTNLGGNQWSNLLGFGVRAGVSYSL